jgi:hypothetical protein
VTSDFSPVPARAEVLGLPAALLATESVPAKEVVEFTAPAAAAGMKATLMVQLAPAASGEGQLCVAANCALAVIEATVIAVAPLFV